MGAAPAASGFARRLLRWHDRHGRHDLPWQRPRTPYRVWLSEVMLQQTQVATVIPYFERFVRRFPSVHALARAPVDAVLAQWSGLGYYARGRNLHRAATLMVQRHGAAVPRDFDALLALPGIGRSTAGAILAQAWGERFPILDGNVRRVLARRLALREWPGTPRAQERLWREATRLLPRTRLADYTQALMDLGASLCGPRAPRCDGCPVNTGCAGWVQGLVTRIPARKPKRARPRRQAHVLLLRNAEGAWLLERRADDGIWGGLWSAPVVDGDWRGACRERYGIEPEGAKRLPAVRHAFTHYQLELKPLRIDTRSPPITGAGRMLSWVTLEQLPNYGLPAPIRRLLEAQATGAGRRIRAHAPTAALRQARNRV
ncbi:MAG TPA: A/G-specific adenine glycosylase [Candidatus Binatia bacterium]|nr:A/G-specific adenine glycosylase [Candidatus Binatia bacterium]